MSEHARRGESFLSSLQAKTNDLANKVSTRQGDWIIKGFVDVMRNLYTLSNDTKVISKVMELLILPELAYFAEDKDYRLILSPEQNYYPDLTFIDAENRKFALDIKTTYRLSKNTVGAMTLGAFTGYFRQRDTRKNIAFPYNEYSGHFILGVIYSRVEQKTNEFRTYSLGDLQNIPSVIKDLQFFAQPKYRIAKDTPGSGNTKNIGSVTSIEALINGKCPFAELGESVFDDYWMYYMTPDMARALDLPSAPYSNLNSYLTYKQHLREAQP